MVGVRGASVMRIAKTEWSFGQRVCELSQRNGVEATGITLAYMQGLEIGIA